MRALSFTRMASSPYPRCYPCMHLRICKATRTLLSYIRILRHAHQTHTDIPAHLPQTDMHAHRHTHLSRQHTSRHMPPQTPQLQRSCVAARHAHTQVCHSPLKLFCTGDPLIYTPRGNGLPGLFLEYEPNFHEYIHWDYIQRSLREASDRLKMNKGWVRAENSGRKGVVSKRGALRACKRCQD